MLRFWTEPEQKIYLQARSDAIKAMDQALKTHEITMPSQNVSVDFGITGGPSLREQLEGVKVRLSLPPERHLSSDAKKKRRQGSFGTACHGEGTLSVGQFSAD